jgi:serine/threonine-protein kinase RsbW
MPREVFPGRYESLARISAFIKRSAQSIGFSEFELYAVETAVDEACSNIVEHAYGEENLDNIECITELKPDRITITLRDQGKPFSPKYIKPPNLKCPLSERKNHGLGLYFIYQWMDEVDFSHEGDTNILKMVKIKKILENGKS